MNGFRFWGGTSLSLVICQTLWATSWEKDLGVLPEEVPQAKLKRWGPFAWTAALGAFIRALSHSLALEGGRPSLFWRPVT